MLSQHCISSLPCSSLLHRMCCPPQGKSSSSTDSLFHRRPSMESNLTRMTSSELLQENKSMSLVATNYYNKNSCNKLKAMSSQKNCSIETHSYSYKPSNTGLLGTTLELNIASFVVAFCSCFTILQKNSWIHYCSNRTAAMFQRKDCSIATLLQQQISMLNNNKHSCCNNKHSCCNNKYPCCNNKHPLLQQAKL